jgi:hypothetical protein
VNDWFHHLFGFAEGTYATTQRSFALEGTTLRSRINDRGFEVGTFETPSLAVLRQRCQGARRGPLDVTHEAVGDALELHARAANRGAMFQVASQFNCLEFADPRQVPEDGITAYAEDPTQGPACALAAAAATVVRNYFVPVAGGVGQSQDRQIDNLDALAAALGPAGTYWDIRNGYTWSDEARLARLREVLAQHDREALLGAVKIGLQRGVGVTFARRFVEPAVATTVSQAFCSALSCGYTDVGLGHWEPLATLVLDAAYEATLRAAAVDAAQASGSGRVWLTFLGGGVFGNRREWIAGAIGRALARMAAEGLALDVRIAHHRRIDPDLQDAVERSRG